MANRARRLAAGASLLATAAELAFLGLRHPSWIDWHAVAFAGALAASAAALTQRGLLGQVLGRSMAWIVLAPTGAVAIAQGLHGQLDAPVAALAATSGAALLLARPMLHTSEARATFAPAKFRRAFLAACTAASTIALVVGMVAYEGLRSGHVAAGLGLGALAASILASAIGVLRMRGWGIALAALASLASLFSGMLVGGTGGVALAATALPGVLFLLPIALAQLGLGDDARTDAASTQARIASMPEAARVRIALGDDDLATAEDATTAPRAAAARDLLSEVSDRPASTSCPTG